MSLTKATSRVIDTYFQHPLNIATDFQPLSFIHTPSNSRALFSLFDSDSPSISPMLDIDVVDGNPNAHHNIRFFRRTNTTGPVVMSFLRGNNTPTTGAEICTNGLSATYFNALGGNFGIGITNPQARLHVGRVGDATTSREVIKIESNGYAGIEVNGDQTDAPGEPGGAYINLTCDTGIVKGCIGINQLNNGSPDGNDVITGSTGNCLVFHAKNTNNNGNPIQFCTWDGTESGPRVHISTPGDVGIGTTSPAGRLHIAGGGAAGTIPPLIISGGFSNISDLYVLNTNDVNTGVGFAAKVFGVNIQNKVNASNQVLQRTTLGGITGAGAIYIGADDVNPNQGNFGVLTSPQGSAAGTALTERFTVRGNGEVVVTSNARLRLENAGDASLASTNHAFQVGPTNGVNLIIDNNEIIARNNGGSEILYLNSSDSAGAVVAGGSGGFRVGTLAGSGTRNVGATSAGTLVISTSDSRKKKNIVTILNSLDKVNRLNPVYFNWTDEELGTATNIGLIAQEVKEVVPELVYKNNDGMYGVHYDQLAALVVGAVNEQKQQIDSLTEQLNAALQRITQLESAIQQS